MRSRAQGHKGTPAFTRFKNALNKSQGTGKEHSRQGVECSLPDTVGPLESSALLLRVVSAFLPGGRELQETRLAVRFHRGPSPRDNPVFAPGGCHNPFRDARPRCPACPPHGCACMASALATFTALCPLWSRRCGAQGGGTVSARLR